ncbi:hypothetical protein [Amycolatopsis sp. FDAARGOS 1241]|uniref:non-homologous end-joining DNA ligase LigD n=1 Tax=Amycolatopsis sp. FDAARGOS 1241 TaxID=2778070 RepID=UPI00351C88DA
MPELVVTKKATNLRTKRVLIEWSRNHPAKTTIALYSLRGRDIRLPPRSCGMRSGQPHPPQLTFMADDVLHHVAEHGDLLADLDRTRSRCAAAPGVWRGQTSSPISSSGVRPVWVHLRRDHAPHPTHPPEYREGCAHDGRPTDYGTCGPIQAVARACHGWDIALTSTRHGERTCPPRRPAAVGHVRTVDASWASSR